MKENKPSVAAASAVVAVSEFMIRELSEALQEPSIGANQLRLLLALRIHGEIQQVNLGTYAGVEKSAISRNVAKLGIGEKPVLKPGPQLLVAERDIENRRHSIVRLTQKGRALIDGIATKAAVLLPGS